MAGTSQSLRSGHKQCPPGLCTIRRKTGSEPSPVMEGTPRSTLESITYPSMTEAGITENCFPKTGTGEQVQSARVHE